MTARGSAPGESGEGTARLVLRVPMRQYAALVKIGQRRGVESPVLVLQLIAHALHVPGQDEPARRGRQGKRFTDVELARMVELKKSGQSVAAIAKHFDAMPETIRAHLRRLAPGTLTRPVSVALWEDDPTMKGFAD